MIIRSEFRTPTQVESDWLVLPLFEEDGTLQDRLDSSFLAGTISRLRSDGEFTGSLGDWMPIHGKVDAAAAATALLGLGKAAAYGPGAAFTAGVALGKRLGTRPRRRVALVLPQGQEGLLFATVSALVEGAIVGTRDPGLRKSEPARHVFEALELIVPPSRSVDRDLIEKSIRRGEIVGQAVNLARDLSNTPPSQKPPRVLATHAAELAASAGIAAEVWDEDRLRHERFGGLLGVGAGSSEAPAFVSLTYQNGGAGPETALVGKGVTFDSGGLSLKPTASMEDMKADMTGAAVVLGVFQAAARLGLRVNLKGYLPLAENMTGGRALKLGDVLTIRNGTTVEVLNTDAEGRLILADALSYAAENKPSRILDLATLTGSCVVALGPKIAGLFCNDPGFTKDIEHACLKTGERTWPMPLDNDFSEQLKSSVADVKNIGTKWGGAITAAKFLEKFVAGIPWAHLDIAGPSWNELDSPTGDVGATGCFVRSLVALLETQSSWE